MNEELVELCAKMSGGLDRWLKEGIDGRMVGVFDGEMGGERSGR